MGYSRYDPAMQRQLRTQSLTKVVFQKCPNLKDGSVRPVRMCTAADFMREGNPANRAFLKTLAINQYAFGCPTIFVGDKADEIAVIFVHRANT